ncbi:hypothetical protein FACS1894184_19280 [Clostridia bacterium]|nr:hypothetical protein FACS1894184_19280 [Clostridia bacterium]
MQLLYGTSNPAKLDTMREILAPLSIELIGLHDLGLPIPDVDESGSSPLENARLKAAAYYDAFKRPVFSCDSGLYINGLDEREQPGVHVRMVNGKRLSDDEMIAHYAAIAHRLGGRAIARYRNGICFIKSEREVYTSFADNLSSCEFYILDKPHSKHVEGFPLDTLSVEIASGEYYYDLKSREFSNSWTEGHRQFFTEALMLKQRSA